MKTTLSRKHTADHELQYAEVSIWDEGSPRLVQLTVSLDGHRVRLTASEARLLAQVLMETAAAAES